MSAGDPDPRDLVRELREAVGLFAGALPMSPKAAWEEAIGAVEDLRADHLALAALLREVYQNCDAMCCMDKDYVDRVKRQLA